MRFWIAKIFWYPSLTKIGSWRSTIYLFKYEYAVPIIPAELAAILATAKKYPLLFLLVIGLMMRLAGLPVLCVIAIIQFTHLDLIDHLYWVLLLSTIIFYGTDGYSLDCLMRCKTKK